MTREIIFVTSNDNKAREAAAILPLHIKRVSLELDEIQSLNLKEVVEHKVRQAYAKLKKPVLVEDVSFEVAGFGGLPGPLVKWFLRSLGATGLAKLLKGSQRRVRWVVGYSFFNGKRLIYVEGALVGTVATHAKGKDGFGFDSIFIPAGQSKTTAQLGINEKIRFSPRTKALRKLKRLLA